MRRYWRVLSLLTLALAGAACDSDTTVSMSMDAATVTTDASKAAADAGPVVDADEGTGPFLGGIGIGITDMAASYAFYSKVFGLEVRYDLAVPNYADEKILYYKEGKASDLVLMKYTDGMQHNFKKNPVKLVFYVPNAMAVYDILAANGGQTAVAPAAQAQFMNTVVGFGYDPDGYILEIIEDPKIKVPYIGAVGVGVNDIAKSKEFYSRVMGMHQVGDLIQVPGYWDEVIMQHTRMRGSAIVIMHWTDGKPHDYKDVPVKLVHFVEDSTALTETIKKEGLPILSPINQYQVQGVDVKIALARDPDGYQLELVTTLMPAM